MDSAEAMLEYDVRNIAGYANSISKTLDRIGAGSGGLDGFNRQVKLLACGPLILKACDAGDMDKVRKIIRATEIELSSPLLRGVLGQTPLMTASARGHAELVDFLCDSKADPSEEDPDGETALHYAAAGCHVACVRILLSRGANASKQCFRELTPLDIAKQNPGYFLGKNSDAVVDLLQKESTFRRELYKHPDYSF
jgi:ankyrin repeat protein